MAEFTANLNPKSNAMSLGDMMKMGLYSAETDVLNRQAQVAREKEKELPIVQNYAKDPDNLLPDGSYDLKRLPSLVAMAPITGPEFADKIINLTKNHIETNKALNLLSEENRKPFASIYGNYGQIAANGQKVTTGEVIQSLERLKEFYPQLAQAADGQIKGWKSRPLDQPVDPQFFMKARNESLTPTQLIDQFAPKAGTTTIGGQTVGTVTQPSVLGEQPTVSTSPLGGGQPMQPTGGATTSKKLPDIIQEDPTFNYTGPTNPLNLGDLRTKAYEYGKEIIRNVPGNAQAAEEGKQDVRKVNEVAYKASGTGAFKTAQDWARIVAAQPDLDILRKNIGRVMVSNANTMGLNSSDKSRGDAATISGSDAISPEALRDIMQRADAQFSATTKFAKAMDNYVGKRGEINSAINVDRFQRKWASNYDSRIFQMDDIKESNYPEAVKKQKYAEIRKGMSEKEFDILDKKAEVIHRMIDGAYQ